MIHTVFAITVARLADLPPEGVAEVAFVGRSNAGKSSAINALANQKRLAYVSKTPGRTQQLNFFRVGEGRYMVDLPGYGYARAPFDLQRAWQSLAGEYLLRRACLRALMLIMDVRHPLTELDRRLIAWWRPTGKPLHVLLSKADKLARGQALAALRRVEAELAQASIEGSVQLFSATRRLGLEEAEARLRTWLMLPPAADKKNPAQGDKAGWNEP
ncbi:MAG: ribosome biogenesis GTP-binding protein YihA/YsxC [Thiobacillaceae bacterium]|nr:ribosome biogenesis GTP-binding protein YihA/YsxC [Thiobacillaceae bacterium]MCX7672494.1 ribosome biogenesis GTP-binding protein YihA/YsxC [Thiobacillaceae bacterium]MDW8324564.1 ribosome biogenesis GTP-binding protein YihA/YsxC [Burkholderiales bacterium]